MYNLCHKIGFSLCSAKTTLNEIVDHLVFDHMIDGIMSNSVVVEQSLLMESGTSSTLFRPLFLAAYGRYFILNSGYDKYQGLYFWNVKCIQWGKDDDTTPAEFFAKIELISAFDAGKNITWQAPVFGLNVDRKRECLSSFVIREEVMPEFMFTEADDFKMNFCAGDSNLNIPGWRIRVSIELTDFNSNELLEDGNSMFQPTIPLVSRVVNEKESELFFKAKKHYGFVCKICGWENIQGVRWSCVQCLNCHLCTYCMKSSIHKEHIMISVMDPDQNDKVTGFLEELQNGVMDHSIQG